MRFLAIPELFFFFFTASRFVLFSVMSHPSRSHNSQSESENLFLLPVVDQALEVYGRQPDLSPDAMEFSCSGTGPVLSQTGDASELPTLPPGPRAQLSHRQRQTHWLPLRHQQECRTLPLLHPRATLHYQLLYRQLNLCGLWTGLAC